MSLYKYTVKPLHPAPLVSAFRMTSYAEEFGYFETVQNDARRTWSCAHIVDMGVQLVRVTDTDYAEFEAVKIWWHTTAVASEGRYSIVLKLSETDDYLPSSFDDACRMVSGIMTRRPAR